MGFSNPCRQRKGRSVTENLINAPPIITPGKALDRTVLLMQDYIRDDTACDILTDALLSTTVVFVANSESLCSEPAQHALVTSVLLIARSGAKIYLDCPNVPLIGQHSPLVGDRILDAIVEICSDLIPGCFASVGWPAERPDLAVFIGATAAKGYASQMIRLQGGPWFGCIASSVVSGVDWAVCRSPFGALASAGLAATEAFKASMRKLAQHARHPMIFTEFFSPVSDACTKLAPHGTTLPPWILGELDFVSGGAITQSALYAISRISGVRGVARVIEPDCNELTNLNRYAFLRRSQLGLLKAEHLASLSLGQITLRAAPHRYEAATKGQFLPFAPSVLVGVDHIPTRWAVQQERPLWLGVGATSHYMSVASYHTHLLGCAGCLHPVDDDGDGPIPTVAFVSHWAGLWLAAMFCRHLTQSIGPNEQSVFVSLLRPDSPAAVWRGKVPRRMDCPLNCSGTSLNAA